MCSRVTRRWILGAVLALTSAVVSCGKCGGDGSKVEDADVAVAMEPPVPAPDALLADVYVATPNATWSRLQRGIGGAVGILPATAGGIMCAILGLDPRFASEIDGTSPLYGVVAGNPGKPAWALAVKLADVRRARVALVDGETARFSPRETAGMTELVPKADAPSSQAVVGITGSGYLVVAQRSDDLVRLAPYATRTLPTRKLPDTGSVVADVPHAALATVLKPKLDELWEGAKGYLLASDERMRRERGGRAPDFGDPKSIVAALDGYVKKRLEVVGDLSTMRVTMDVVDEGMSLVATLTPASREGAAGAWTRAMSTGDTAPVAAFPASAAVALTMRDAPEARAEQMQGVEKVITGALGSKLAEADAKKLHDALDEWTKARGDVAGLALAADEPQGLVLRSDVRDAEAAQHAMKGTLDLARVTPFKDIFRIRDVATSSDEQPGIGKVSLATLTREPARGAKEGRPSRERADAGADASAAAAPKKDELGVAWLEAGGTLSVAMGDVPVPVLRSAARPERRLADEPAVARALAALGTDASAVLVVQPLRFDPSRANLPVAPLVVGLGRKKDDAFVRVDVAHGLLRELARWQTGL